MPRVGHSGVWLSTLLKIGPEKMLLPQSNKQIPCRRIHREKQKKTSTAWQGLLGDVCQISEPSQKNKKTALLTGCVFGATCLNQPVLV